MRLLRTLASFVVVLTACGSSTSGSGSPTQSGGPEKEAGTEGSVDDSPSYAGVVLPELETNGDGEYGGDADDRLMAVRVHHAGGVGLLFRDHRSAPDVYDGHLRYVTRDGDATLKSTTFRGGFYMSFDLHPSGEATVCVYEDRVVQGDGRYWSVHATRLSADGEVRFEKTVFEEPKDFSPAGCDVIADGEDALVFSGSFSQGRVDRLGAGGDVTPVRYGADVCLPFAHLTGSGGPNAVRTSGNRAWFPVGCEVDLATGKTLSRVDYEGMLLMLGRGIGDRVHVVTASDDRVFVDDLPPSGSPTKLLDEDPISNPYSASQPSTLLVTTEGWTMPEATRASEKGRLNLRHAPSFGAPDERLSFDVSMTLLTSLVGQDGDLYLVALLWETSTIGTVTLETEGTERSPHVLLRFRDWHSIAAAHAATHR